MAVIIEWSPLLLNGLVQTLKLFFMAVTLDLVIAVIVGLGRLSRYRLVRAVANIYVEFFRGISLYVTLFWLYFALPFLGVRLTVWEAAVGGLALVHGAYASEYVRGAILSVGKEQHEASIALNMTPFQRMRYVVFPQALVAMMPLLGNECVLLLKATSVTSLITLAELTEQGHAIIVRTYASVPVLVTVLLVYFAVAQLIVLTLRRVEVRIGYWKFRDRLAQVRRSP
jgi:polar amino acid transport system permease protein